MGRGFSREFCYQFGRKWDRIRWKSHHFLSKFHDLNSSKIHVMFQLGKRMNPDKRHGIVKEFGVDFDDKLPWICDVKWRGISMRSRVTFFTGKDLYCLFIFINVQARPRNQVLLTKMTIHDKLIKWTVTSNNTM